MDSPGGLPLSQQADFNPYSASSESHFGSASPGMSLSDAERIRHELITHEVSIKLVGTLYLLGVVYFTFGLLSYGATIGIGLLSSDRDVESLTAEAVLFLLNLLFGGLTFWIGKGLWQFNLRVRIVTILLSALGLLSFPFGTLVNGYIIYLLAGEKGTRVFSSEYQEIVRATPHVKYQLPWLMASVMAIVLGAIFYLFAN